MAAARFVRFRLERTSFVSRLLTPVHAVFWPGRLGADITDYFNYGFTEETWRQYAHRQLSLRGENMQRAQQVGAAYTPLSRSSNLPARNMTLIRAFACLSYPRPALSSARRRRWPCAAGCRGRCR